MDAAKTAREILAGAIDPLEGCRMLLREGSNLRRVVPDAFDVISAIASELDDIPKGAERRMWSPQALAKLEHEERSYIAQVREQLEKACRQIVAAIES